MRRGIAGIAGILGIAGMGGIAGIPVTLVGGASAASIPVALRDADHAAGLEQTPATASRLPPDEAGAGARLNSSPRHGEWVKIDVGGTPVNTWVVYPERTTKAPVVLVIQEIFGLTDWIRGVADQLAADGFIAIAPDLLSGHGPNGGGTEAFPNRDAITKVNSSLPRPEVNARLNAVRDYGLKLPAANGRSASIGFCWGGSSSFAYAVAQPGLNAAVVYYGTAPAEPGTPPGSFVPSKAFAEIKAPILGLYGGADARVNASVPATEAKMKELGKRFEAITYDGAGHGFLRAQGGQDGANMRASEQAWPRTLAFLREHTR